MREIAPGAVHQHAVQLKTDDYVGASITRRGKVDVAIYRPNELLLRRFITSATDGKQQILFVAESEGRYRIELTNPSSQPAEYELRIHEITPLAERLRTQPWIDRYESPRIAVLQKEIASGRTTPDAFWNQVKREGTPLIEPQGNDGRYQLATFLWRGKPSTQNVLVLSSFPGSKSYLDDIMHRVGDTDIWYLTKRLPSGARFEYRLSPNDPLVFDGPRAVQRRATAQADPLNPHDWDCPPNSTKFACSSSVELPGAVPQPWIVKRPETPAGKIETHSVRSEIQQLDRPISVYVPSGYRAEEKPYPLLVLFDAHGYLTDLAMPTTMDNLIAASKIPATVAVLIHNVGDRRLKDLVPNPQFADFMAKELVPWMKSHYNITNHPDTTVVGGFSAGGLAAAYMGLRHPSVFGNVLSQSGAFWWAPDHYQDPDTTTETNWMVKQFIASPKLPVKFYLDAGTFEMDRAGEGGDILEASRHLRDVLLAKGYVVHYQQFVGGHDGLSWRGTLADGLIALIGRQ